MKIGNTELAVGLCLAPMAGYTDRAMRRLCRRLGAEYTVTEMVSAAALCYGDPKTGSLARLTADDMPTAVQLFGHDPDQMERAVRMILSGEYPGAQPGPVASAIDLNMGCPVRKIVTAGDGSALMRDPTLCGRMTAAAVRAASLYGVPVTVKIRAGWDDEHKNAVEVAKTVVSAGAQAICVHARTRAQMYAPGADYAIVAAVRDALPPEIPVIGNGDVTDADSYLRLLAVSGCDGVAIGRGAMGNPWLFSELRCLSSGDGVFVPPTEAERRATAMQLAREIVADVGETVGVRECRGRIGHFLAGFRGAAAMRERLHRAETLADIASILEIVGTADGIAAES